MSEMVCRCVCVCVEREGRWRDIQPELSRITHNQQAITIVGEHIHTASPSWMKALRKATTICGHLIRYTSVIYSMLQPCHKHYWKFVFVYLHKGNRIVETALHMQYSSKLTPTMSYKHSLFIQTSKRQSVKNDVDRLQIHTIKTLDSGNKWHLYI